MSVTFVSDLHLDPSRPAVLDALSRLCSGLRSGDELFVLGDLFEVWIGDDDDDVFSRSVVEVLREVSRRASVSLLHGNRDFLLGERFAAETGVALLPDPFVVERGGYRLLLSHGDAWCTRDAEYQRLRAWLRTPGWCTETLARPLAERREIARAMRAQSRTSNSNKPESIMDVTEPEVSACARTHGADTVVHGHTHRPGIHLLPNARSDARRYVLGDWDRCGWALTLDANGFALACLPLGALTG